MRPISLSHWELRGTRRGALLGGVQIKWDRGPHPGMDIFPDLSPRVKPYYGVKCSQGLHFPATDCGACRYRGHNPPAVSGRGGGGTGFLWKGRALPPARMKYGIRVSNTCVNSPAILVLSSSVSLEFRY